MKNKRFIMYCAILIIVFILIFIGYFIYKNIKKENKNSEFEYVPQEEISEAVGKSRPHITNTLRLLNLPQKIMDMIDQGQITAGHGKALLRVNDENLQLELANKVIAEELSVRATEALAKKICEDNIKEVPKKSKEKDVFIVDVEEKLRNIFGTKVNISKGKKKGKIEIEYYNEDDLNNIVSMLLEDN